MTSLADRAQAIGQRAAERASKTKTENAKQYPEFVQWLAEIRAMDPDCRLIAVDYLDTGKQWLARA